MIPTTSPRLSGNHFDATGIGVAYPNPLPAPTMMPNTTYRNVSEFVKLVRKNPRDTRTAPSKAAGRGPRLSCSRPPATKVAAKVTTAIVNTHDVCARFQPNSFSSGSTNTLHAYSDPSARFIKTPPTTTRHRFISASPLELHHTERKSIGRLGRRQQA